MEGEGEWEWEWEWEGEGEGEENGGQPAIVVQWRLLVSAYFAFNNDLSYVKINARALCGQPKADHDG